MKILQIVPSYKPAYIYGGPIESVSKLCEGLVAAGNQVDVFTTTANGNVELELEAGIPMNVDGVMVTYFKRITKDPTHISPALWRHLFKNVKQYDIVHIQSWWNVLVIIAACICHFKKVKVIISPRGMLSEYIFKSNNARAKSIIHKYIGKSALTKSWFHATANTEAAECRVVIPGWKGFVQPNILTLPELIIKNPDNAVFTMIFLSRIHPKKGIEVLLRAIAELEFPVLLKIAGSGEEEYIAELKTLATQLEIAHQIEWLGWLNREEKFVELMNADLFVLSSYNENFANVVVEALHMGTAVLISAEVALAEFVKENEMGWVSPVTPNQLKEGVTAAFENKDKRKLIRETGRDIIAAHFSSGLLIDNYAREYVKIINTTN